MVVPPFYGPQVFNATWEVEGEEVGRTAEHPRIPIEGGGPEYFRALGIRLLQGRGFLEGDRANAPKVAVVSEAALRLLELGTNPIGRRIRIPGDTGAAAWRTIVGIAGDIHYRDLRRATPTIYLPSRQFFFQGLFAVRIQGSLRALLPALNRALHDADPAASVASSQTMTELVAGQRALPRFTALLLSGFAIAALVLAAIGLYGLTAAAVRADTREIGVRMALGATPARLGREILRRALGVSVAGAAVGLVGALAGARLLRSLLFEVSPTDPITLGAVSALLVAVALAAAYLPARRAMRIDPAQALRAE
jgi:putative ABC transport system permease protein